MAARVGSTRRLLITLRTGAVLRDVSRTRFEVLCEANLKTDLGSGAGSALATVEAKRLSRNTRTGG